MSATENRKLEDVLETLAFQAASTSSERSGSHGSRLARIPEGSWQADILRESEGVVVAETPEDLRKAMGDYQVAVVFLPQASFVTAEVIERICNASALDKLIVWETAA